MRLLAALMLSVTAIVFVGCQSKPYRQFERAKVGMTKDTVLEEAGHPTIVRRWQSKDRWIYEFPDHPNGPQVREIHFADGKAIYVGPEVFPKEDAAAADRKNAQMNSKDRVVLDSLEPSERPPKHKFEELK